MSDLTYYISKSNNVSPLISVYQDSKINSDRTHKDIKGLSIYFIINEFKIKIKLDIYLKYCKVAMIIDVY
jgi:hypothetical protein